MSSRETIINSLRQAAGSKEAQYVAAPADAAIYSDYPKTGDADLIDNFSTRLTELKGECFCADSVSAAGELILRLINNEDTGRYIVQQASIIDDIATSHRAFADCLSTRADRTTPSDSKSLATYTVGISTAELLVARTGSIISRSLYNGGRRFFAIVPFHIVVAYRSQIVPSLDDVFVRFSATEEAWSHATIISGPSRTSDIEKNLVLGAHGPKRLAVIIVDAKGIETASSRIFDDLLSR